MFWHYCNEKVEFKSDKNLSFYMINEQYENKIIVLQKKLEEYAAHDIIEDKKTDLFRSLLRKPKKDEVDIHSLKLFYECILLISCRYTANYYLNSIHTISVDHNVQDIVIGDGTFEVKAKSKIQRAVRKTGKNKIDLKLDEHVFIDEEDIMYFDHHGKEIKFPFTLNSKTIENYPKKILTANQNNVKKPEIPYEGIIAKISSKLKKSLEPNAKKLTDKLTINEISEIYVPIYEARLVGPKKKVAILRVDAIRKKIL